MTPAIITLTTDFGQGSPYVAQMKGVILSLNPRARLVDITHNIAPQDVPGATYVLDDTCRWFPDGTIHVVVVDPGVGTERDIAYARIGPHHFIAPNNGLLTLPAQRRPPEQVINVEHPEHWRGDVSSTFHGRDIMAPVAARLSLGLDPIELGPPLDHLVSLELPGARCEKGCIRGTVVSVDSFGNLITNIDSHLLDAESMPHDMEVHCGGHIITGLVSTYGAGKHQETVALLGSAGRLEIAIPNGNAADRLQVRVGDEVSVLRPGKGLS